MKIELDQVKQQLTVSEIYSTDFITNTHYKIIVKNTDFSLKHETSRIRADNKLDINLERSRVTDMVIRFFKKINYILFIFVYVHLCGHTGEGQKTDLWELGFSFHHVDPRDRTQVAGLCGKCLSPLRHLAAPLSFNLLPLYPLVHRSRKATYGSNQ